MVMEYKVHFPKQDFSLSFCSKAESIVFDGDETPPVIVDCATTVQIHSYGGDLDLMSRVETDWESDQWYITQGDEVIHDPSGLSNSSEKELEPEKMGDINAVTAVDQTIDIADETIDIVDRTIETLKDMTTTETTGMPNTLSQIRSKRAELERMLEDLAQQEASYKPGTLEEAVDIISENVRSASFSEDNYQSILESMHNTLDLINEYSKTD